MKTLILNSDVGTQLGGARYHRVTECFLRMEQNFVKETLNPLAAVSVR